MAEAISQPFRGSRRLDSLSYLLVWIGAAGLLLVPEVPPRLVLAFCLLLAPSRFLSPSTQRSVAYRTAWRLVTAAFILLSLLDWYWGDRPFRRETLVVLICFLQAYRAYNSKEYRDYLQMAFLAMLMIIVSGSSTESVFFLVVLVPFVAVLVGFLLTMNLCRYYLPRAKAAGPIAAAISASVGYQVAVEDFNARAPGTSKRLWVCQAVAVFFLGAALFYVLPRDRVFSPSHFAGPAAIRGYSPAMSGLAVGVNLRHLSAIKSDPRPVLKVTFPAKVPPLETIYMRSASLERFSNLEWSSVQPSLRLGKSDADGVYWLQRVEVADRPLLIPHVVEFLNAPGQALVALSGLAALDQVEMGPYEPQIALVGRLTSLKRYRALSWGPNARRKTPPGPEDEFVLSEALKLPETLTSLETFQKAAEITYGCADNLERAKAVEQHLRSRYSYTLNIESLNGPVSGPNPIQRFLFDHPQGNCEVFASAMVVLCRNLQIPSRLAIGYHGGIPGDSPNSLIFRNQDAHAWVEVWSPQRGWATFDPTPPPPLEVYSGRFSFKKIMEWFGTITGRWNQLIVWYDGEAEARWMSYLWGPIDRWVTGSRPDPMFLDRLLPRVRENITRPQIVALLAGLIGLNLVAAAFYLQARRRWRDNFAPGAARHARNDPFLSFYCSAVSALRGKVKERQPAQTPSEFLEALARSRSLSPMALGLIVDLYHRGRFGSLSWDKRVAEQMRQLLRRLADSAKEQK